MTCVHYVVITSKKWRRVISKINTHMYNATVLINGNLFYWIGLSVLIGLIQLSQLMEKWRIIK